MSLVLWRDISPDPIPLRVPTDLSPTILVVGGGVTGLVNAWVLLDRGYNVTIVSKEWASVASNQRLTSQIAGALWEFPPAVCGSHINPLSLKHSKGWAMTTYHILAAIASTPALSEASGIKMTPADFFFFRPVEEDIAQHIKMLEIMSCGVLGFVRSPGLIKLRNINPVYGAVDAYEHLAPVIDTDKAMGWLMGLVKGKGAKLTTATIEGELLSQEHTLRTLYNADAIVNASGLASIELAADKLCYPLRGALLRVINDGSDFPKVNTALTVSADAAQDSNEIVFLVPRNDNTLIVGGIAQPNKWDLDLTPDSPIITRMRARCENFLPALKKARLDPKYPLAQGLRPARMGNVRIERDLGRVEGAARPSRIVHVYGQGGSGWSFSFGGAADVAELVEEALRDMPPKSMEERAEMLPCVVPKILARL